MFIAACSNQSIIERFIGASSTSSSSPHLLKACCWARVYPTAARYRAFRLARPAYVLTFEVRHYLGANATSSSAQLKVLTSGVGGGKHVLLDNLGSGGLRLTVELKSFHPGRLGSSCALRLATTEVLLQQESDITFLTASRSVVNLATEWDPNKIGWFKEVGDGGLVEYAMPGETLMRREAVLSDADCSDGTFAVTFLAMRGRRARALMTSEAKAAELEVSSDKRMVSLSLARRATAEVELDIQGGGEFRLMDEDGQDADAIVIESVSLTRDKGGSIVLRGVVKWLKGDDDVVRKRRPILLVAEVSADKIR